MELKHYYKKIAGLNTKITCSESRSSKILIDELRYYEDGSSDSIDVIFCFFRPNNFHPIANNPSSHFEYEEGIGVNWGGYSVVWTKNEAKLPPTVYFYLNVSERRMVNKLKGMQFTHPFEEIGQIFHEGVLQPTLLLFFSDRLTLIHGSAVSSPSGHALVFGGTGGVGKTSLELELILHKGYSFIADDISILNKEGSLIPNFNLPKIYGYNLLGYEHIEKKLFVGKSFNDKLWWKVQKTLRRPNKFRRRADIDNFYSGKKAPTSDLKRFIILYRSNVKEPHFTETSPQKVAKMNTAVMYTEFARLFNALKFHEFNREKDDREKMFSFKELMEQSEVILIKSLEKTDCGVLQVPMEFSASDVKEKIPTLLEL